MNGKSRTRYSPKWQTQPPPPTRVCLTLPADRPLTSPTTSVQTRPTHSKIIICIYRSLAVSANRTRPLDAVSRSPEVYGGGGGTGISAGHAVYTQTCALVVYIIIVYTYYAIQTIYIKRIYRRNAQCLPKSSRRRFGATTAP